MNLGLCLLCVLTKYNIFVFLDDIKNGHMHNNAKKCRSKYSRINALRLKEIILTKFHEVTSLCIEIYRLIKYIDLPIFSTQSFVQIENKVKCSIEFRIIDLKKTKCVQDFILYSAFTEYR